jgi:hypothetical protein
MGNKHDMRFTRQIDMKIKQKDRAKRKSREHGGADSKINITK